MQKTCELIIDCMMTLLVLIAAGLPICTQADDAVPVSFDQFIDSAPGQDVPPQGSDPAYVYRAKRVNKNLWTFIDIQGYYILYRKKFDAWCKSNGGTFSGTSDDMMGICSDQSDSKRALGRYKVQLTTTASYDGRMTAGYAMFYYTTQEGLAQEAADEAQQREAQAAKLQAYTQARQAEAQAQREATQRNEQCFEAQQHAIQQNLQPGMETNAGMVVAVKLPLAFVQEHTDPPATEWVRVSDLGPAHQSDYCATSTSN
jgi:hypothetical protein